MGSFITSRVWRRESGHVLVGMIAVLAIGLLVSAGLLQWSTSTLSTRKVVESNTKNFYAVERSINAATAWLQYNSKNIVTAFKAANFSNNFDLGDPAVGVNEGTAFAVPTLVKMKGTNNAVQLTNSAYFGASAFPATTNIDTNAAFNAASVFASEDFGEDVNVRLLMVWALETDGHYQPIFRIDATTGGDGPEHGVHGVNFVKSALITSNAALCHYADDGDFQTGNGNNQCWSYQYTWNSGTSSWSRGAPRSNCNISGKDDIALKSAIHGTVFTNKVHGINLDGGSVSGATCEGSGCVSYTLPNESLWDVRCAGVPVVDLTVSSTPHNLTSGPALAQQCYRTVTVPSNKTLNFATSDYPYHIKTLTLQNNSNSKMTFPTVGTGHKYELHVDKITGDKINGNQLVSTNLAPHQLELYIPKNGTLTLNGTADMNAIITGNSNHTIVYSGNFTFYGALRSNAVSVNGNAVLGCDEDIPGGTPILSDLNFTLYKASQRYR